MSELLEVSDDALKLLVAEHGVRGTARLLRMDERQTDAFRQRVTRGKWLADPAIAAVRAKRSPTVTAAPIVAKVSPQAAIASEIASLGSKTRLSLARGMSTASKFVEEMTGGQILDNANEVKAIAQTADLVHGWKDATPQVKIRLDVLSGGAEAQPIDISADVSPLDSWDNEAIPADPLDEY